MSNRDLLKPTPTKQLKKIVEEDNKEIPSSGNGNEIKLNDGLNKLRVYPKHPKEKDPNTTFMKQLGSHWVTIEVDGEPKRRKIPDGAMHGGLSIDVIEAFIKVCQEEIDGEDEDKLTALNKMTDKRDGMQKKVSWLLYADHIVSGKAKFGFYDFSKTVRDGINAETIIDDEDEAIELDPFTHPDDGKLLLIDYNSKAKSAKDYYKSIKAGKNSVPLSEEQVDLFVDKVLPLSQLSDFKYTDKEFEIAVEACKYVDELHDLGVFDGETFQEILSKLKKEMKSKGGATVTKKVETKKTKKVEDDEDEDEKPVFKKSTKKVIEEPEDEEQPTPIKKKGKADKLAGLDRSELKEYIAENDLEIKVYKPDTDEDIRQKIRKAEQVEEPEEEEELEQVVNTKKAKKVLDDEDAEEEEAKPVSTKKKFSIADVRKKISEDDED